MIILKYEGTLLENGKFPYDATFKVYIEKLLPTITERSKPVTKTISLNSQNILNTKYKVKSTITSVNFIECDNMTYFREKMLGDVTKMKASDGITDKFDTQTATKVIGVGAPGSDPAIPQLVLAGSPPFASAVVGSIPMSTWDHTHKITKPLTFDQMVYEGFDKVKLSSGHIMVVEFLEDDFEKGKITFIDDIIER